MNKCIWCETEIDKGTECDYCRWLRVRIVDNPELTFRLVSQVIPRIQELQAKVDAYESSLETIVRMDDEMTNKVSPSYWVLGNVAKEILAMWKHK